MKVHYYCGQQRTINFGYNWHASLEDAEAMKAHTKMEKSKGTQKSFRQFQLKN